MISNQTTRVERTTVNCGSRVRLMPRPKAILAIAAIGIGSVGASAPPASAGQPLTFDETLTIAATNPCTGTSMTVTIEASVRLHVHGDRFVAQVSRAGATDDGYVMDHGVETALFNGQVFRQAVSDRFRHEDGSQFRVHGVLVEQDGVVRVDRFSLHCLAD